MKRDPSAQPISPRPLHTEVADRLRHLIAQGELAPGDRLNERLLTERFGISRTPLREAIKMLASEGLVQLLPNRGAIVTAITNSTAADIFELIVALESFAGELACQRATDQHLAEIEQLHRKMRMHYERQELAEYIRLNQQIHNGIVDCAGNSELIDVHRKLSVRLRRARYVTEHTRERWDETMAEHEQILEALMQRNGMRLRTALANHLGKKFDEIQERLAASENEGHGTRSKGHRGGTGS